MPVAVWRVDKLERLPLEHRGNRLDLHPCGRVDDELDADQGELRKSVALVSARVLLTAIPFAHRQRAGVSTRPELIRLKSSYRKLRSII